VLLPRRPHGRFEPGSLLSQLAERLPQAGDLLPEAFRLLGGLGGGDPPPCRRQLAAGVLDRLPRLAQPPGGRATVASGNRRQALRTCSSVSPSLPAAANARKIASSTSSS
jgi:hypothetical protein